MINSSFVLVDASGNVYDYYDSLDDCFVDIVAILRHDEFKDYTHESYFWIRSRDRSINMKVSINNGMFDTAERISHRLDGLRSK